MKAGAIAAFTAGALYVVGNLTDVVNASPIESHTQPDLGSPAYAFNIAGHALVGCGSAEVSGGKCGPAALAGGVTSAAGPFVNKLDFASALVANSALGGAAAVAGGGKFENGAITGAFGYLFNSQAGALRGWAIGSGIGAWASGLLGAETGPVDLAIIAAGRWAGGTVGAVFGDWLTGPDVALNQANVPQKAQDVADSVDQTGNTLPGYRGGNQFQNDGRGGGELLPKETAEGASITYQEWDVNPYTRGVNRGSERIVTGSDGSRYYTNDHYSTFTKF